MSNLTKDEISDLRSFIERKQQTALALESARLADEQAQRNLDSELNRLEYRRAPKETK